jgi:hypothetical protein
VVLIATGADGGFQVDYGLLAEAAKGINGVIRIYRTSRRRTSPTARSSRRGTPWSGLIAQGRREVDEIKAGPWWLQAAKTAAQHPG